MHVLPLASRDSRNVGVRNPAVGRLTGTARGGRHVGRLRTRQLAPVEDHLCCNGPVAAARAALAPPAPASRWRHSKNGQSLRGSAFRRRSTLAMPRTSRLSTRKATTRPRGRTPCSRSVAVPTGRSRRSARSARTAPASSTCPRSSVPMTPARKWSRRLMVNSSTRSTRGATRSPPSESIATAASTSSAPSIRVECSPTASASWTTTCTSPTAATPPTPAPAERRRPTPAPSLPTSPASRSGPTGR